MPSMSTIERTHAVAEAAAELRGLLESRVTDGAAVREHHSHGESYHPPAAPDLVCFPETTGEVAAILAVSLIADRLYDGPIRAWLLSQRRRPAAAANTPGSGTSPPPAPPA